VDGRRIEAISDRDARFVFAVPAGAKSVTLASRASIPADRMDPMVRDSRRIGVRVLWAAIRAGEEETIFPADHPELRNGWHAVETYGPAPWRWTNGAATIPWQNVEGPAMLTVRCYPSGWYAVEQNRAAIAA
jgi:antigen 43